MKKIEDPLIFTKRTYRVARRRQIDRMLSFYQPKNRFDGSFQKEFDLGVRITERGRREKGLWT